MGKFNSSVYRVRPLMETVEQDYTAFLKLLSLVGIPPLGVPKCCGYEDELTKAAFAAQLDQETIRIPRQEKAKIPEAFCGYTTWQEIKKHLPNLVFQKKPELA